MQGRSFKGKSTLKLSNGWLQIVFNYQGQRKYFSVGLKDTPENRRIAEDKARWIDSDILNDRLDETLDRYRSKAQLKLVKPDTQQAISVREVWRRYLEFKKPLVSPNTMKNQFTAVTTHLSKLPKHTLEDAIQIRDWLLQNLTPDSARRTLMQLAACCRWAQKSNLIASNPFRDMSSDVKIPKTRGEDDIDPFTKDEQRAIETAFQGTRFYHLIRFYFLTGCRTGEGIYLKWDKVRPNHIIFNEAISAHEFVTDTKTHRSRKLPINPQLRELLQAIKPAIPDPNDYVFPGVKHRTLQGIWKKVVTQLVTEGKVERYRFQYNTRHTFITNCLAAGVTVSQVAKWVGNSPEIILKHYAGTFDSIQVPEL